jgi:hypothetical protein
MLNQFSNCIRTSKLNLPIAMFEKTNNLRDSTPNDIMEYGCLYASNRSDSIINTITYNAQPVCQLHLHQLTGQLNYCLWANQQSKEHHPQWHHGIWLWTELRSVWKYCKNNHLQCSASFPIAFALAYQICQLLSLSKWKIWGTASLMTSWNVAINRPYSSQTA